jgi:drug/metabolite transporter (DMT)-like permease
VEKLKKRCKKYNIWVILSVLAGLAMAPNGTAVKILTGAVDSATLAVVRYSLVAIVLMTIFFIVLPKHKKAIKKHAGKILLSALPFSLGGLLYTTAIAESSASFVSVLLLLTPIIFGIFSTMFTRDKVTRSSVAGMLLAILGGVIVILAPILTNSHIGFYGIAPLIIIGIYILLSTAYPVVVRRENESGVPLIMVLAIQYTVGAIVTAIVAISKLGVGVLAGVDQMGLTDWLLMAYLVVVFCVLLKPLSVKAYEKTGTSTAVAVSYLEQVLAVVFPVLVLSEQLTWEMAVGAALIIAGIILTRKHHIKHNPHRSHQ